MSRIPLPPIKRQVSLEDGFLRAAPETLRQTQGASWLPDFIATQVDRSVYATTEGGAGSWAFGALNTPQRAVTNWMYGWDPDVADKIDPNWTPEQARNLWGSVTDTQKTAAMYAGGQELVDDIINNSVSYEHFSQRLHEIEVVTTARLAIEDYDKNMFLLTAPVHKTFSAVVNYVASDPTTVVSIGATGYMAAAKAGLAASGVAQATSIGGRIASISEHYSKTWRAATYLWDTMDGASSAYSSWSQLNNDGVRLYGKTFEQDTSYVDDVAFGAGLGVVFSAGSDALGALFKRRARGVRPTEPSTLENVGAASPEGHLHTPADLTAMSLYRHHKSRLAKALDYAEQGPDSSIRRQLMDDTARADLGWGSHYDMADLADWVEKNRPNTAELQEYVEARSKAAAMNRQAAEEWGDEVSRFVEAGGEERHFFRKKSMDFIRSIMGEEADQYKFIVDWLEEATGDARLVANYLARGDRDRILRAANAVNSAQRIVAEEARAFDAAMVKIKETAQAAEADAAQQAANRVRDGLTQGRWRGAIDILNEMHEEVRTRHGRLLGEVDASINFLNDEWTAMNAAARRRFGHYGKMLEMLKEYRRELGVAMDPSTATRDSLRRVMSNDASASDVLIEADFVGLNLPPSGVSERIDALRTRMRQAKSEFDEADAAVRETMEAVGTEQRVLRLRFGGGILDKTMTMVDDFPSWKVAMTEQGFASTRAAAVRQTKAANRWKVEFVDRFLGDNAADNALASGTSPMRPVITAREPMRPLTAMEQDKVLADEMAKVAPEIARIRQEAADVTLDDKIAIARSQIDRLRQSIAQAKTMAERGRTNRFDKFIAKRERMLKRMESLERRLQKQLDGQVDELNKDLAPTTIVTPESMQAAKSAAKRVEHDAAAKKLAAMPADKMGTSEGRKLRNKVRRLSAEVQGGTEYSILGRESGAVDGELAAARARVTDLESRGSLDGDPDLVSARSEVKYLEKKSNDLKKKIQAIEGRPAAMRRSHELQGNSPKIADVRDLTDLRMQLRKAIDAGNDARAQELNAEIYNRFGDSTELPQWKELEDLMYRLDSEADNPTKDVITDIKMDGREVVVTIRRGENLPMSVITRTEETGPARAFGKERGRYAREVEKERMDVAVETTTEPRPEKIEEVRFKPTIPSVEATVAGKPVSTNPLGGKVDPKEPTKSDKIIAKLTDNGKRGERILITNGVLNAMGRVPVLRGLGRAIFRLQTAGTGFGEIHNVSRSLDLIVSAMNMLDRPEALARSLGFNGGVHRTLQNFKDQGRLAVNEVAVAYQRAIAGRHWTNESDLNVQRALDAGSAVGLNPGEASVFEIIQRHYRRTGERLNVSRPGTAMENYRAREGNANAIMRNKQGAQDSFTEVYTERMMSDQPLDNELCDELGLVRGITWNAMNPAQRAVVEPAIRARARYLASQTINRLSNGIVEEGVGYRIAAQGSGARHARVLEDVVANDARVRQWYIQSPIEEFKRYMEIRAPQIHFDAQLSEMIGEPTTFDEVLDAIGNQFASLTDETVKSEAVGAIRTLRSKWDYHTGRAQYNPSPILDASIRTSTGVVRGSFGAFWGLAGLATEVPRAIFASKMYGGSLRGFLDALSYLRRSGDLGVMEDVAHATDQYSSHAHSSFGTTVGASTWERFTAPWERFFHVAMGREAITTGGVEMNRGLGTLVSLSEAFGETGMRAGGMHYFAGMARFIADAQAKRFISRNVGRMADLAERLRTIGSVSEQTPENIARFKQACSDAGIPYDVAIRMNHAGLLDPDVVGRLRDALTGLPERFDMRDIRNRLDDRSFSATMDFLTDAHNFHVPTSSLASSVESRSALDKMFYNLTSYARAFSLNVMFRSAANARLSTMMATYAAVAIGENIYQSVRDVAMGNVTPEELEKEWSEDPVKYFAKRTVKTPWLGAHNSLAMSVVESVTTGSPTSQLRGNNLIGPVMDLLNKTSKAVYADEITGERDWSVIQTYTPILNTWYSRLTIGPLEN